MKKLFFILAIVSLVAFGCTKTETDSPVVKKVGVIPGSFNAQYGDISLAKDYVQPLTAWNVWTMLRQDKSLVNGTEFITGSAAQLWWSVPSNNPVTFSSSTSVYSNLTPDENVRLILEAQDVNYKDAYLGIVDFNPNSTNFPLNVKAYRLGDYLGINADALFNLPGANLTITVTYQVYPIDLAATKALAWNLGQTFGFKDIVYNSPAGYIVSSPITTGNFTIYNGIDGKIMGGVTITVNEAASSSTPASSYVINVPQEDFGTPGKGVMLKLTTTKVGWYDSQPIGVNTQDIQVEVITVPVN